MAIIHQLTLATIKLKHAYVAKCIYNIQIKHSQAYQQNSIPNLAGMFTQYFIPAKVGIVSCRYARECFICRCIWLYMFELAVANTDWWMIAISKPRTTMPA